MFIRTNKISDVAIKNILELNRITYIDNGIIRIKGKGELYYLQITENGVFAGHLKEQHGNHTR